MFAGGHYPQFPEQAQSAAVGTLQKIHLARSTRKITWHFLESTQLFKLADCYRHLLKLLRERSIAILLGNVKLLAKP
jgi:hypothetical protein